MKVSAAALTLLVASTVASASSSSSSSKNSKLRNNNNKKMVLPVRRSLAWGNWDIDRNDIGQWFNQITGTDNEGDKPDWLALLTNNLNGGSGGGGGQGVMDVLTMIGGIDAFKDTIDWDFLRESLGEKLEEMLKDGNFDALPDSFDWNMIANIAGGDGINWQSIFDDVDPSTFNVDWLSLFEDFDLSELLGEGFDFDFENILSLDWTETTAWQNLLSDVLDGIEMSDFDIDLMDVNACEVIQLVNGIGPVFGVSGNCTCDGNLVTGLLIDCGFSGCAFGDGVGCGEVSLDLNLAQDDDDTDTGLVDIQACTKFNEDFEEACIFYAVDMSNEGQLVQTCSASYGDGTCECSIDDTSCVTIDCSAIRDDAVMDECMPMGMMSNTEDFDKFVPTFRMLVPTVEEEVEENVVIVKPNTKKQKFRMDGKNKKRPCKFVKKMIETEGKDFVCDKPATKKSWKKLNKIKTVGQFCPAECA